MDLEGKVWISRVINYSGSFSLFRGDDDIPMSRFRIIKMVSSMGTLRYIYNLFEAGFITVANGRAHYSLYNPVDIRRTVIPLLSEYPLKDKRKHKQYQIWRSGIAMLCRIGSDGWTDTEISEFDVIAHNLERQDRGKQQSHR